MIADKIINNVLEFQPNPLSHKKVTAKKPKEAKKNALKMTFFWIFAKNSGVKHQGKSSVPTIVGMYVLNKFRSFEVNLISG